MNKKLWQQADALFNQSLNIDEPLRAEFIASNTADQDELRHLVEVMLMAEEDDAFMHTQPSVVVNENTANNQSQLFGHFTIIKKIAVGGMGRIFKARSNSSDIDVFVALKLIRRELLSDQMALRFDNEKAILGKLKHHHIAVLIDAGVVNQTPYIATEWIAGQPINEYVKDNELNINQTLGLFLQTCEAVAYAHTQLVIHRDLKPANILIDSNQQVKLLDFGIAKLIDHADGQVTQTQVFTPDYAAPEQINGETCTTVTDIYALGVLLFELLVGEKRFRLDELSVVEKVQVIANPKTVFASQVLQRKKSHRAHKLKGALDTIINKAMHVDPNRRYSAVYELISDIKRYQQHLPIQAMGDGWVYRSQMFIRRNPWPSLMSLMLVLSLTVGLIYSNQQKQQALKAQSVANFEAEKSQQMLSFFISMLESAAPASGGSTDITVKQMFKDGAEKFSLDGITDPALKADIAGQIAEVYGELYEYELSVKYHQIALEHYQADLPNQASDALYHHLHIAANYSEKGQYEAGFKYLKNAYEQVKMFEVSKNVLAEAMVHFGRYYMVVDQQKQALDYFDQAEKLAAEVNDLESLGKVKYYQYMILQYELAPEESEAYLLQAQAYFEQAFSSHPNLISVRNSLGIKYLHEGQYLKANDLFEIIHLESLQMYGFRGYNELTNHANVVFALGDFQLAAALTKESLQLIKEKEIEQGLSSTAATIVHARSLTELGRYAEAEQLYLKAFSYFRSRFADDHVAMFTLLTYWLDFLIKSGRVIEHEGDVAALIDLAHSDLNESIGTQRKFVTVLVIVATYHWVMEDHQLAIDLLQRAQKTLRKISLKQEWSYWLVEAGVEQLRGELGLASNIEALNTAKQELFLRLPENHWYHVLFKD